MQNADMDYMRRTELVRMQTWATQEGQSYSKYRHGLHEKDIFIQNADMGSMRRTESYSFLEI